MTEPIDDVSDLPGKKVSDQEENEIGKVKDIYAMDGDGEPMWVTIAASFGMSDKRTVLIPLARLKQEDGELRVPYSSEHIKNTPEIENEDEITDEEDRNLRDHYGIDRADQELRSDNYSYATMVSDQEGTAKKAEDADSLETPDADQRDEDTKERLENVGSSETRDVDAGKLADESTGGGSGGGSGSSESKNEASGGDEVTSKREEEPGGKGEKQSEGNGEEKEKQEKQ